MRKNSTEKHTEELKIAADNAVKTIANAAESATKLLSSAAESASRLIASNAAEALKVSSEKQSDDHDILVVLASKMEDLKSDIKDLKDNTTKRVDNLETNKLNILDSYAVLYKADVEKTRLDHETRIRDNEKYITQILTWGSVGLLVVGILEGVALHFLK